MKLVVTSTEKYPSLGVALLTNYRNNSVNRKARTLAEECCEKDPENKIEPIAGAEAVRALLGNVLCCAREPDFVEMFSMPGIFVVRSEAGR